MLCWMIETDKTEMVEALYTRIHCSRRSLEPFTNSSMYEHSLHHRRMSFGYRQPRDPSRVSRIAQTGEPDTRFQHHQGFGVRRGIFPLMRFLRDLHAGARQGEQPCPM